jgi:hypothetical protein
MATTTNYSWSTPDDTALVKDGAAAIRSLGTAIDTTVFTNAGAAIAKATVDAKGDLIAGTADNTVARLAVGANNTVLTADSSTATGLKWAAAGASGKVLQVVYAAYSTDVTITSNGSYRDTGLEATITPSATGSKVLIFTNIPISWTRPSRDGGLTVRLLRGATSVFEPTPTLTTEFFYFDASTGGNVLMKMQAGLQYLDSPSTTSATTYKQQFNNTYATSTATAQQNAVTSTMILMEIGA